MSNKDEKFIECEPISTKKVQLRKYYCKPRLHNLGDLRTLTLGMSPGFEEDSGTAPEEYYAF